VESEPLPNTPVTTQQAGGRAVGLVPDRLRHNRRRLSVVLSTLGYYTAGGGIGGVVHPDDEYITARRYNPEDQHRHIYRRANLKCRESDRLFNNV
jgi:hypothetical protein